MLATLMAAGLLAAIPQADTVFPVPANARLVIQGTRGDVVVRAWDRNQVRVETDDDERARVSVSVTDSRVVIGPARWRGAWPDPDLTLTVPAGASVEVEGAMGGVDIVGVGGEIVVSTVRGDIDVSGGARFIRLHATQGDVTVSGAEGRMDFSSVNGEITVRGAAGALTAATVNGDIMLEGITSDAVDAETTNGDILYDGTLSARGRYTITTHGGDVTLVVPEGTSATVSVSSFSGEVESEFPLTLRRTEAGGKRYTFTLGAGEGRIEVGSFSGTIHLRRP